MFCLVVYDIPDDAARTRVADTCLDYGLHRIQFSAFTGDLSANHQEELFLKIRRQLGTRAGNVQLFPICERDFRQRRVLEVRINSGPVNNVGLDGAAAALGWGSASAAGTRAPKRPGNGVARVSVPISRTKLDRRSRSAGGGRRARQPSGPSVT